MTFVYQFTVTNNGPDLAHTVIFSHTLPSGIQDASADSTAGAPIISGSTITAESGKPRERLIRDDHDHGDSERGWLARRLGDRQWIRARPELRE